MLVSPLSFLILFSFTSLHGFVASTCEESKCPANCDFHTDIPDCTCPDGMILSPDSKTCRVPVTILLGMNRAITAVMEGKPEVRSVLPVGTTAFDFHYNKRELIAFADNNIMKYKFAGDLSRPGAPTAVITPTSKVSSLAVDWIHQDIYWISQQRSAIESASLTGNGLREVVVDEVEDTSPEWSNLVVDPYAERLFWVGKRGVFSCDLRGKNLKTNMTSWPISAEDIALDTEKQLIYIIGNHGNGVKKVVAASHYNGTSAGDLIPLEQPGSKVFGFGVLEGVFYWESNHEGENLYKIETPITGERVRVTLLEELNQIVHDMKIYHPDIQKTKK